MIPSAALSPCAGSVDGPYPVVQAHAKTNYDAGVAIGSGACARIRAWLSGYAALHDTLLPFVNTAAGRAAFNSLKNASCGSFPEACDELRGLADGAGVDTSLPMVMSLRHELSALARRGVGAGAAECTDVLTDGALAHNEDGDPLLQTTGYYVNQSVSGGVHHLSFRYPASLAGHAFGFNQYGLVLSMNAVTPTTVRAERLAAHTSLFTRFVHT